MAYLLFIVFITLVIALIVALAKDSQNIDKKKRVAIALSLILVVILGGIYTTLQDRAAHTLYELQSAFSRGEELRCQMGRETISARKEDFEITSGIKSLQGRANSPYQGVTILLESCSK
ncbi:hypothetical protein [uncultured Helicobacter sp.]|uniref:hypothetical protein n=1 Tax=uncultured Helicobacter sp. TaxID=175537 RepID=UPI0037527572